MNDTPPEIARQVRERIMALSGEQRMAMGSKAFDAARAMAMASFPPNLSDKEFKKMLCLRIYGPSVENQLKLFDLPTES